MPLKVSRSYTSIVSLIFVFISSAYAQSPQPTQPQPARSPEAQTQTPVKTPTAGEIMHERISKAKAFIAVRNYPAAVYELESIRRESADPSVNAVAAVLLMNSFLEQGNYKRAQELLTEAFRSYKANNSNSSVLYPSVAGQVVKGARNQTDRYRGLGLAVSERNLPLEAVTDIEQMRSTLEMVVSQAKEIAKDKEKIAVAIPLLEEAVTARSALGRDEYDARRWRDEIADSREQMASSQSVILNAVTETAVTNTIAENSKPLTIAATKETSVPSDTSVASLDTPEAPESKPADNKPVQQRPVLVVGGGTKANDTKDEEAEKPAAAVSSGPVEVGSLINYATKQQPPTYPATARQMRATGVVRLEIEVDENGEVAEVNKASGPTLLQPAARDAIKKWRFKPFTRDGQPVRATGFVNFNFSL